MQFHKPAFWRRPAGVILFAFVMAAGFSPAARAGDCCHYGLTITTAATRNVSFHRGVFRPTKKRATLNINDLENALASGNIVVTTGDGPNGTEQGDLHIEVSGLTWSSNYTLTLDAYHSIFVDEPVTNAGPGGFAFTTNDGGQGGIVRYGPGGHITISDLSSQLTINGQTYTPVADLPTLASDISSDPGGHYALASSYDAGENRYDASPITAALEGAMNGLGNTISNVVISDTTPIDSAGLFRKVGRTGVIQNLELQITIYMNEPAVTGGLVGVNLGQLTDNSVASTFQTHSARQAIVGGLVGTNSGAIARCNVATRIATQSYSKVGGLVGMDAGGAISQSFATGSISAGGESAVGGLIGSTAATSITDSYSTVSLMEKRGMEGGLVGGNGDAQGNNSLIATSYSTGYVLHEERGFYYGGMVGLDNSAGGSITSSYWDMTTSGVTDSGQGAGSPFNDPGITGDTDSELKAALPSGFDPAIWKEDSTVNGGLPYLIANPPPQ